MTRVPLLAFLALSLLGSSTALADDSLEVSGAELVHTEKPAAGFVDTPFVFDPAGARLAFVNADAAALTSVNILDLASKAVLSKIDISGFTSAPTAVEFALDGSHVFVWSKDGAGEANMRGALFTGLGKLKNTYGPAVDVRLGTYAGKPAVITYEIGQKKKGKGSVLKVHTITVSALATGKRLARRAYESDHSDFMKKHEFRLKYWADNYLRMVGIKSGTWDKKEDQRSPDFEAWYDTLKEKLDKSVVIGDVVNHTKLIQLHAEHQNQGEYLMVAPDLGALWRVNNTGTSNLELAEPLYHYDLKSLRGQPAAGGGWYFSMRIDPVHPDAAAKKKAVVDWIDIYELKIGANKAVRLARIKTPKKRDIEWHAGAGTVAVVLRHAGFGRGGAELKLYRLAAPGAK